MTQSRARAEPSHSRAPLARALRQRSTDAERALSRLLRARQLTGVKVRRQRPFGPCFLDFYCIERRLAIEADGSQHLSPEGSEADARRTQYLAERGVLVLRFTNREILLEGDGVIAAIEEALTGP